MPFVFRNGMLTTDRLAFHLMMHDAQSSMALLVPPLLSYAEISLDMPAARDLWLAKNAQEWQEVYLTRYNATQERVPQLSQCIYDIATLRQHEHVDLAMSTLVVVYAVWTLIWDHLQLSSVVKLQPPSARWNGALIANSWHQELSQLLKQHRMNLSDWKGFAQPGTILVLERTLLNLYVSFEHVQLFAGKEGEEEARRVYPMLSQWAESSDARQALWHAGQVLRAAKDCAPKQLRNFNAICLYHASLAFWAYAVLSKATQKVQRSSSSWANSEAVEANAEIVWLDGGETPAVQRFIALNRGTPVITDWNRSTEYETISVPLDDAKAVSDVCIEVLRKNMAGNETGNMLPLVENLSQLMRDLGDAVQGIGRS